MNRQCAWCGQAMGQTMPLDSGLTTHGICPPCLGSMEQQSETTVPDCILDRFETLVQRRLCGRIHDFRLLARGPGLVLQGHAHSYHAKQLAQAAVMAVSEYPIVANDIVVF